jgi:hypothetical protein
MAPQTVGPVSHWMLARISPLAVGPIFHWMQGGPNYSSLAFLDAAGVPLLDAGEDPCPTCRWPRIPLDAATDLSIRRWARIPLDAAKDLTTHMRRFGMLLVSH